MSILCVDDDQSFLSSMIGRLRVEGFEVSGVANCDAALKAFTANPFAYDIVITDMDLGHGDDGEQLVAKLIELREVRGYDTAPEIICITGKREKMESSLVNLLKDRGCQYVLKGSEQFVIETHAAIERLKRTRGQGPLFLFVHGGSEGYQWNDTGSWGCSVGETVSQVFLLHAGTREEIKLDPTPRRLFDFIARRTSRRALSVEEVANSMALDEFYSYWQVRDKTISSDSVKTNINRIRVALGSAFTNVGMPLKPADVLATETYEDQSEPSLVEDSRLKPRVRLRVADGELMSSSLETSERYRLRARAYVEHVP